MKFKLTDGTEIYQIIEASNNATINEQLEELNNRAEEATDSNLYWAIMQE